MSDFDTAQLTTDWESVLQSGGSLTFTIGAVTASGIWAARLSQLEEMEEQLRDERKFTVFSTVTQLVSVPTVRATLVRSGVTYFVEAVRNDAEGVGVELDVRQVF